MDMSASRFKILSLDGGGTRGYLSALVLKNIQNSLNKKDGTNRPLGSYFDLIVGTSTGAIIGLGLAIGMTAGDIAAFYEENIPKVFTKNRLLTKFRQLFRPIYTSQQLAECLDTFFEDKTLADVKTDVCITCTSLQNATPRLYKSDYLTRNASRLDEKIADIAVASSAAPVYFKAHSPLFRLARHSVTP